MTTKLRQLLPFAVLLLTGPTGLGQGIYIDSIGRPSPTALPTVRQLELTAHRIKATIRESLAEFEVEQVFRNLTDRTIEGTYLFPLPRHAIATGLALAINGELVEGEVLESGKARGIYQNIVRRLRDPALLEYVNEGLLKASIFPIAPRAEVRIVLRFAAPVERVGELYFLTLPLKFAAGSQAQLAVDVRLHSSLPLSTIYSPSHDVDVVRTGERDAQVTCEGPPKGNRDFLLYFARDESELGLSLITHRLPAQDGTFALLIAPRIQRDGQGRQPRDVVFVLDRSGSMAGDKWQHALGALRFGLRTLEPIDRFALVSFATDVRTYKPTLVPATNAEVRGAIAHLEQLRPAGGTNIAESLETALGLLQEHSDRLGVVPFLTDGLPTIGQVEPDTILKQIAAGNRQDARLFCIGIGYDVNTLLLDRLAEGNGGSADYIAEGENVEVRVSAFFDKTRDPVLTAPRLDFGGLEVFDLQPRRLPDLFAGTSVMVTGRYRGAGKHAVTLTGGTSRGQDSLTARLDFPAEQPGSAFLPALWAARKVGFLLGEIRLRGAQQELVDEVIALGREYGIVTPYTSTLVVEEGDRLRRLSGAAPEPGRQDEDGFGERAGRPEREAREELRHLDASKVDEESGEEAVRRSKATRSLAEATSAGAASQWGHSQNLPVEMVAVAGRRLVKVAGLHIDAAFRESMTATIQEVEAFSDSYFTLLEKHPELAPLLALGGELLFVLDGRAIRIR